MEQKNLILAIVLSLGILLIFEFFITGPMMEEERARQEAEAPQTPQQDSGSAIVPGVEPADGEILSLDRGEVLKESPRLAISSPRLQGSIALKGGQVDDLTLITYREDLDPSSPNIVLLSPAMTTKPYFANFGWSSGDSGIKVPNAESLWQADRSELTPGGPVTLTWDNGEGLTFERVFDLDEHYMLTVTQSVANSGNAAVTLSPYGLISRTGTPQVLGFYILHEGLLGVFDGTLREIDYDELQEQDRGLITESSTGGWLGITDKYWLVALVPDQERTINGRFLHSLSQGTDKYQVDYLYEAATINPGASVAVTSRLFAGAKEVLRLDDYRDRLGIVNFDLAVDFGWFYFLTKPGFYLLHYIAGVVGNFGVAILILTVLIKLAFFPLANKSYVSMAKMRKLQPKMLELRERYGDDKQRLNQEMMGLYKKEGANPMSGCLPILVQIPVFFALYKVLFVTIEMRHAPFFGWIQDLSARDPTSILNGFGLLPWEVPDLGVLNIISLGVWPIVMGVTMYLQQLLNPQPTDPVQAKIFLFMPIVFTFLLATFPAGLVIYWTWNNILSIIQQAVIMKRAGVPIGRQPSKT